MMNLRIPVSALMTEELVTIGPLDSMKKVEDIFAKDQIHHLPVIDEGKLVGLVSKTDYYHFKRGFIHTSEDLIKEEKRFRDTKIKEVMTTGLAKLEPEDRLEVALEVFKENLFHAIPIVRNGFLKGIITTWDIINYVSELDEFTHTKQ